MGAFFQACFLPCTSRSRGRYSRRLACLHSHVLRAYCNFESKLAISLHYLGDAQIKKRTKTLIGYNHFTKHLISSVHKMTTSANAQCEMMRSEAPSS